jgi:DNA-binding CsgD family transcriptional regulator
VSGPFETNVHEGPDLGRLSAAERQALELLAQGHTAKSIAGLTGQSEAAINERLRSARRKTGVGSSRELARLLSAQKKCDENIGLSAEMSRVTVEEAQATPKPARLASLKGSLMLVTLCAAATALVFQATSMNSQTAPTRAVDDPLVGSGIYGPLPNYQALHDQVRGEPRAEAWAARAEATLRDAFDRALQTGGTSELRVICGSTLCEAAGVIAGDRPQISAAMKAVQGRQIREDAGKAELSVVGMAFGTVPGHHDRTTFLTYWKRQHD